MRVARWFLLYTAATLAAAALAAGAAAALDVDRTAAIGILCAAIGLMPGTVVLGLRGRYGSPAAAPGLFALGAALRFAAAPGGVLLIRSTVPRAPAEAVAATLVVTLLAGLAVEFAALRSNSA
ncbi:hypothetical protein [Alienimonas chondri]|uniref:Uncharacterized protein n=1 Tax=Alienimonas chondri TaxID=2681879 RepID=A0ABX1VG61_9PLAN|nr:hypothetical protein [Alienimonas chondri]NNJ26827.1 hypothetical protein [Alienimonas chondri]